MSFGLPSALSASQKILSSILAGFKSTYNICVDVIVHGNNTEKHEKCLDDVLYRI